MNRLARLQAWLDKAIDALRWPLVGFLCGAFTFMLMRILMPH